MPDPILLQAAAQQSQQMAVAAMRGHYALTIFCQLMQDGNCPVSGQALSHKTLAGYRVLAIEQGDALLRELGLLR